MRLHRFYIHNPISATTFDVGDTELVHQWRSVFRYNVGSQVILFDGSGTDYLCIITSLRNLGATMSIVEKTVASSEPKRDLWLCMGLIKKDNFELVVQKATELGVTHIIPVLCERSEKKSLNMERLQKIIIEASEQSGRGTIPNILEIQELPKLLEEGILPKEKLLLNLEGEYIHDVINSHNPNELAIFIGPEGGWSDREVKEFEKHNIKSVSLGTQVLRAETAAIATTSLLLL
jgi:16S rRNA (uracil1498-N3)-methyltransferase